MKITIAHDLLVFPLHAPDSDLGQTLPPGTYQVEETARGGGERWWKICGQDAGNSIDCWKAVEQPSNTRSKRLELVAKKTALLLSLLLFGFSFVKTDWAYVSQPLALPGASGRISALLTQYLHGSVYSVSKQANGEYLVSRYAAGWQLIYEAYATRGRPSPCLANHLIQLHKELLMFLVLIATLFPSRKLAVAGLKFLLPVLLLAGLGAPVADPKMDQPLIYYYLMLASTVAALLWNSLNHDENQAPSLWNRSTKLALIYNAFLLSLVLFPEYFQLSAKAHLS